LPLRIIGPILDDGSYWYGPVSPSDDLAPAGPNASHPRGNLWNTMSKHRHRHSGTTRSVHKIRYDVSRPAINDYHVFRCMIVTALISSLHSMLNLGYEYAIMASPSSGIYAGHHKQRIQSEYHHVCIQALNDTYMMIPHRFIAVIIPKY